MTGPVDPKETVEMRQLREAEAAATTIAEARSRLTADLRKAGVRQGCPLLVHTSLSAMGQVPGGADTVIDALLDAIGPKGTLVIPTLSYLYTNADSPRFDVRSTPTNLGTIPETFRLRTGVARSMHPTHSCCAKGPQTPAILGEHRKDRSPVGANSPFRKVRDLQGQVAFLGVPFGQVCICKSWISIDFLLEGDDFLLKTAELLTK